MKKIFTVLSLMLIVVLLCLSLFGCNKAEAFDRTISYVVMNNGFNNEYYADGGGLFAKADIYSGTIIFGNSNISIKINKESNIFMWMIGTAISGEMECSAITSRTKELEYTRTSCSAEVSKAKCKVAALSLIQLLNVVDSRLSLIDVSVRDLGFINFW